MKKTLKYSIIAILVMLTVVCSCLIVGCDSDTRSGDYTLQGFSYSITDVGEGYIDINKMSETDHSAYDSIILMYGKRVHITSSTIRFVDGMILSGYGDTEYTINGEKITFSDSTLASTFNYVTLSNGVFSIGVSQTVSGITVKYSFDYYSDKATAPTYTIYFDSNGGTDVAAQTVKKGEKVKRPLPYPKYTGYTFDGWYTDYKCTDAYDFSAQVLRSFTLYAKWEPNENKVTFNSNGGTSVKEQTVLSGYTISEPASPTKAGYTFSGWYSDSGLTKQWNFFRTIFDDITLYAKWEPNSYTISFNAQPGTCATSTKKVTYSAAVGELPVATREGYVFDGWYDKDSGKVYNSTTVYTTAGNITLYARWVVKITLDPGSDGSVSKTEINASKNWKQSDVEILPVATTAKDWTFAGWFTEPLGHGMKYDNDSICEFEEPITLYAAWSVTIKYDTKGGDVVPSTQVVIGNSFAPATPVRIGYTFMGWHDPDGNTVDETTVITYDKTTVLTASWTVHQITFKFDAQGGSAVSDRVYTFDSPFGEFPATERENFVFGGWFSLPKGYGKQYNATDLCKDDCTVTLYAKWVANVFFDYEGATSGNTLEKLEFTYGADIDFENTIPQPYKTGFSFEGWFTERDGQGTLLSAKYLGSPDVNTWQLDNDTTFYAYWVKGTDKRFLYYKTTETTGNITVYGVRDSSITEVGIPAIIDLHPVDEIAGGNFTNLLTKIILPETVKVINKDSFKNCWNLQTVTFEDNSQLTSIGYSAFYNCIHLTSITIPATVTVMDEKAFLGCSDLQTVTFEDNSQLTSIGDYAFVFCHKLQTVTFGDNSQLTSIGFQAFYDCNNLTSITIPAGVTSIGSHAFRECTNLASVTFGDNSQLTSIGFRAFDSCNNLTSITIPASVTRIGAYAFSECTNLASVTFENPMGWWYTDSNTATSGTVLSSTDLSNSSTAAEYLVSTYSDYYWNREN